MKNLHVKHYNERPWNNVSTCCNSWRQLLSDPLPSMAVVILVDVNNPSEYLGVYRTNAEGVVENLKIEPTHWTELGDICKPGGRKCRIVSPIEKAERTFHQSTEILKLLFKNIKTILLYILGTILLFEIIRLTGYFKISTSVTDIIAKIFIK